MLCAAGLLLPSPCLHSFFAPRPVCCSTCSTIVAFCRFAIQEAVLTLVRLHQTFTFQLDTSKHPPGSSLEYVSGITLMPKDGIWLQPMKRDV